MKQLLKKFFALLDKGVAKNGRAIVRVLQSVHARWLVRIVFFLFRESVKQYDYSDFSAISFKFVLQRALRFIVDNKIEGSYSKFVGRLDENNIAPDSYSLYEGFYNHTLTPDLQKQMNKAAIVHAACDLYSSTREVLEFIKPLLQQGTIVMFNSFYYGLGNPHVGESAALQEFLENNKDIQFIDYYNYSYMGKVFIVNKALA